VSFVKPVGQENEHPGYTDIRSGDRHLVDLIKAIQADKEQWASTAIVVTYDEFGGEWDHVRPPTAPGISDIWGPGTRIPAMVLSPLLPQRASVDHTVYDTASILSMIEHRFGLEALSPRDAADHSLGRAFRRGLPRL
jgi:acid phosphatase